MVCCGKRIIQEGPPFVPPQGDRIKGMGGSGRWEVLAQGADQTVLKPLPENSQNGNEN